MADLMELMEQRAHVVKTVDDLIKKAETEKRDLTPEELAEVEDLKKQVVQLNKQVEAAEATDEARKWRTEQMESLKQTRGRRVPTKNGGGVSGVDEEWPTFDERMRTCGRRSVFTRDNFGPDADHYAYRAGQWWLALTTGNAAAHRWCNEHGIETRALQGNINTAGGVTVPVELEQAIIIQRENYGVARRECRVVPMSTDTAYWPRVTNAITSYYLGEGSAATESDTTFDNVGLNTKELVAYTRVSNVLAEDAIINIGDLVANEFAYSFAKAEDEALFNGDGTSTYGGINGLRNQLSTANALAGQIEVADATHNLITEIDIDDLLPLMAALPEYALGNAKWYVSPAFWSLAMLAIAAAGGGQTFETFEGGMRRMFLGYPVVVTPSMPNGAATDYDGVVMALFGDLNMGVYLGDRRGITVMASQHRHIEYRQTTYLGSERYAIAAHGVGDTSTAGPIVGLTGSSS
jgi:HK97 family phage major capsid protein